MKVPFVFLLIFVLSTNALTDNEINSKWNQFQKDFPKNYRFHVEHQKRFDIFKSNVKKIEAHNAAYEKGKFSYALGINQFADWTADEFMDFVNRGRLVPKLNNEGAEFHVGDTNKRVPKSIDWKRRGAVTSVKDQGNCGSCWAFSAIGSLEGQLKIKKRRDLVPLSEQNLVDCSTPEGNNGCGGGLMDLAYEYIQRAGIEKQDDYVYTGVNSKCRFNKTKSVTRVRGYRKIRTESELELTHALATIGPISVGIDATQIFQLYHSGILEDKFCSSDELNHGVVAVGYGRANGTDYYLVKNSWGTTWGERGYIRMPRNRLNKCGIATDASYPIL